jgi:peptidoglycan/LPS O-acetylase OafA/YrhL
MLAPRRGAANHSYRPDIDGLRAVAILGVVAFHVSPKLLPGGFVGVDIFLVISGFLISGIILANLDRGTFSLVDFYSRRIRRIFPALIVVLVTVLAIGWLTLLAGEYRYLGKHIVAGGAFVSNLVLFKESGYFDSASETKPLLHLWSLAVEEQFYICWPLMLSVVWSKRLDFRILLGTIAIASFIINIHLTHTDASAAFYSPLARFWELMIGGILAYTTLHQPELLRRFPNIQSLAGFALIAFAYGFIERDLQFPGWWALLPTVGAALIICAGSTAAPNRILLSNRAVVFIGLISYPLYLWHWPLLSLSQIIMPKTPAVAVKVAVAAAFALAWLTYRFIDRPVRRMPMTPIMPAALAICMAAVCAVGFAVQLRGGFPNRAVVRANRDPSLAYETVSNPAPAVYGCDWVDQPQLPNKVYCMRDGRGSIRYAMLGDSKAGALIDALMRTSDPGARWEFIGGNAHDGSPEPVISEASVYRRHQPAARAAVAYLAQINDIDVVVFAMASRTLLNRGTDDTLEDQPRSPWSHEALAGMRRALSPVLASGKRVVLVVDNPTLPHPDHCTERRTGSALLDQILHLREINQPCRLGVDEYLRLSALYRSLLAEVVRENQGRVFLFDTLPYVCDLKRHECLSYQNGRPVYGVTDHVSEYTAGILATALNRYVSEIDMHQASPSSTGPAAAIALDRDVAAYKRP